MKTSRGLFIHFMAWSLAALSAAAALNYFADPHYRHRFRVPREILQKLENSADHVLLVPPNYDDRSLLRDYIPLASGRDVLVLGGSRVMNINEGMFAEDYRGRVLNAGVTNGFIKDYAAVWQLIKESGFSPRAVIIGVDGQSLDPVFRHRPAAALGTAYERFSGETEGGARKFAARFLDQWKELLSLRTTLDSAASLGRARFTPRLVPAGQNDGRHAALSPSFSLIYPKGSEENISAAEVLSLAELNGRGEQKAFQKWEFKNKENEDILARMVSEMKSRGARVLIVLMPCHPASLEIVNQEAQSAAHCRLWRDSLVRLAGGSGALFYDGFNDAETILTNNDFIDGVHLGKKSVHALLRRADAKYDLGLIS